MPRSRHDARRRHDRACGIRGVRLRRRAGAASCAHSRVAGRHSAALRFGGGRFEPGIPTSKRGICPHSNLHWRAVMWTTRRVLALESKRRVQTIQGEGGGPWIARRGSQLGRAAGTSAAMRLAAVATFGNQLWLAPTIFGRTWGTRHGCRLRGDPMESCTRRDCRQPSSTTRTGGRPRSSVPGKGRCFA